MYTVLLTDDEQIILQTLTESISWQQLGVDKIYTASNGQQALDIMNEHRIDLLITDIKMPHMDGMELLTQVRSTYPAIHCILLTAYGEFEYARAAIQLGVENYLLKPFQQKELEGTIEKALDNIYRSRENSKNLFMNNILFRWASGNISNEELSERAIFLDINIYLQEYCVVCIKKRKKSCSLSAYFNTCKEFLTKNYEMYPFWDNKDCYAIILGGNPLSFEVLSELFTSSARTMKYESSIILAMGMIIQNIDNLQQSYQTACHILETKDSPLPDSFILLPDMSSVDKDNILFQELNSLFHKDIFSKNAEDFKEFAEKLLFDEQDYHKALSRLANSLFRLFQQEFPDKPSIQKQLYDRIHLFSSLTKADTFTSAATDLLEYSFLMFQYYFEELSPVIQHIIEYIQHHYNDSLSIKEFCVKNKMSTAYLGYLFKKETGMFFNNYLTQYRISCSLRLLQETTDSIQDIATAVGFSSASYFISCFRKQTGLSPIKYRALKEK